MAKTLKHGIPALSNIRDANLRRILQAIVSNIPDSSAADGNASSTQNASGGSTTTVNQYLGGDEFSHEHLNKLSLDKIPMGMEQAATGLVIYQNADGDWVLASLLTLLSGLLTGVTPVVITADEEAGLVEASLTDTTGEPDCDDEILVRRNGEYVWVSVPNEMYHVIANDCMCQEYCIAAIIERQPTAYRSPWSAGVTKTLNECIAEVNLIAPHFISGTYSGGASAPTMRTSSYATGASDFCDLYALICALRTTKVDYDGTTGPYHANTGSGDDRWVGWYRTSFKPSDWDTHRAAADSVWAGSGSPVLEGAYRKHQAKPLDYISENALCRRKFVVTPVTTSPNRAARLFMMSKAPPVSNYPYWEYSSQGYHSLTRDQYTLAISIGSGSWTSTTTPYWPDASATPALPSTWPTPPESGYSYLGYAMDYGFALFDWSFAHQ